MKRLIFALAFLALASTVHAQTTATAVWNQAEAPIVASTFVETLQIDVAPPVMLTATCVAALAPATGSVCSAPFTVATPTANHSYVLIVCNSSFCASMSTSGSAPGTSGFKIKVTVIVGGGDDDEES